METDWNAKGLFTAQIFHIRLNLAGIAEAERMADRLEGAKFDTIYCSDQVRALETAVIIGARHPEAGGIVTDPLLREVNVGYLVGSKMSEVTEPIFRTRHPQFDYRSIGGECRSQVVSRQHKFIRRVEADRFRSHGDYNGEVLVVGHGTALRVLLEDLKNTEELTRENFVRLEM